MFSPYFGEGRPTDYRQLAGHDARLYNNTVFTMIGKGVMPCPDAREPWFICAAHTDEDVATTLQVFDESLAETMKKAGTLPSHMDEE
jgi:glutamate-1-semialdehyde 2,1-aminomutase